MNYEFLLPLIGAGVAAAWTYGKNVPETKTAKLTFVEDEVPLTGFKDAGTVLTQTGQVFKVVGLSGQSIAGKRADDLEKAAAARALFFRRISENKVHLRLVSQKTLTPVSKKPPCGNPFLDALVERWESGLEFSFKTRHYIVVSSSSENDVDAVIREIFIALSDLEPVVLTKSGKDGVSPLLTFLSSLYNAEEIPVSDKEKNIHRIERSRIKIDRNGLITQTFRLTFGIKDFGESVSQKIMDGLLALPYPITVSVHAVPVAKSAALSNLDKRKSQMNLGKKEFNSLTNEEIRVLRDIVESGKLDHSGHEHVFDGYGKVVADEQGFGGHSRRACPTEHFNREHSASHRLEREIGRGDDCVRRGFDTNGGEKEMRKLTILALLTVLTACSTSQSVKGIGSGTDSYKLSPCACQIIVQPNYGRG